MPLFNAPLISAPDATDTTKGIVELATNAETTTGTDATRATTPASVKAVADTKANLSHTHASTDVTDFTTAVDARITASGAGAVPTATTTVEGKVELATTAETTTGTDTARAVTPAGVKAVADTLAPLSHTHTAANVTDFNTAADARVNTLVPAASETVVGKVELATAAEATTGTDTTRAVHPAGLKAVADTKAALSHSHTASDVSDFNTAADARVNSLVPAASETVAGKVELATNAEATTGTDTTRAVHPAGLKAVADTKAALSHTHTASNITDFNTAVDARFTSASETAQGKVELATTAEANTGTDTARAVPPAGLKFARPAMAFIVIYSSPNWQYKGSTITARPSEMQTGDIIQFVGNPGGALPAWAATNDLWTQG